MGCQEKLPALLVAAQPHGGKVAESEFSEYGVPISEDLPYLHRFVSAIAIVGGTFLLDEFISTRKFLQVIDVKIFNRFWWLRAG